MGTLAVMGGGCSMGGTANRGLGEATARPGPSSLYQMYTTDHSPTACIVPISVLLYGPLLCGFNVPFKGLRKRRKNTQKMKCKAKPTVTCKNWQLAHVFVSISLCTWQTWQT